MKSGFPHGAAKKTNDAGYINVRWHANDLTALDFIAKREDRNKSEIVRSFTRWCIGVYNIVGSLKEMQLEKRIVLDRLQTRVKPLGLHELKNKR